MTLKNVWLAVALAGGLLTNANMALAQRGMTGGAGTAPSSSPTSGALPGLSSSGALPRLPTSGALPGLQPSFPTIGQTPGASTMLVPQPSIGMTIQRGTPYQPPCGAYPLPQC